MRYLFIIVGLSSLQLMAQSELGLMIGTGAGYEYNIFNAGPQETFDDSLATLLQSAAFQYTQVQLDWENKWKQNEIDFSLTGQYDHYAGLRAANLFRPRASLRYGYNTSDDAQLYSRLRYGRYETQRGVNPNDILGIPTTYQNLDWEAGYIFRPFKNTWLTTEGHARQKRFAATTANQLQYLRLGLRLKVKQRFKPKGKTSSYLYATLDWNKRNYIDLLLEDELENVDLEEEQNLGERLWRYQQFALSYRFRKWNAWRLETGLSYLNRQDILQERLGYRQVRLFSKLKYRQGPWKLSWETSYIYRPYTDFPAERASAEMLLHQYWRNNLSASFDLNETWQINLRASTVKRWRNAAENATNFLPYFNAMLRLGITVSF